MTRIARWLLVVLAAEAVSHRAGLTWPGYVTSAIALAAGLRLVCLVVRRQEKTDHGL